MSSTTPVTIVGDWLIKKYHASLCPPTHYSLEERERRTREVGFFLHDKFTRRTSLGRRVKFLREHGYTMEEIESAMEEVRGLESDYRCLLQYNAEHTHNKPLNVGLLDQLAAAAGGNATAAAAAHDDAGGTSTSTMMNAADGTSMIAAQRSCDGTGPEGDIIFDTAVTAAAVTEHPENTAAATNNHSYWRVGTSVFAFSDSMTYYPVPLVALDYSRGDDFLGVRHRLPNGDLGPVTFYGAGFKGVVPDEYVQHHLLRTGMTVLARVPNGYRSCYREAVIEGIGPMELPSREFTVDIQWCHDSTLVYGLDYHDICLLHHPRIVADELAEAEMQKLSQGMNERHDSSGAFVGFLDAYERHQRRTVNISDFSSSMIFTNTDSATPPADTNTATSSGAPVNSNDDNISKISTHVKSFLSYREIDISRRPRDMTTGQAYISHFGDAHESRLRVLPVYPDSQQSCSGIGFRFDNSSLERYPRSPYHTAYNPILKIIQQCQHNDSMYIDPDFPPSEYSLWGVPQAPTGDAQPSVTWRRLTEIVPARRVQLSANNNKVIDIEPGLFTPPWMPALIMALRKTSDYEEIISPETDGDIFGVYTLRMYVDGFAAFVTVDNFVPCDTRTGKPVCCMNANQNEIFPALVEKALAKLERSYTGLRYPRASFTLPRAWEDFTGFNCDVIHHQQLSSYDDTIHNLCEMVEEEMDSCAVYARLGPVDQTRSYSAYGFIQGQLWAIDCVRRFYHTKMNTMCATFHVVRPPHMGPPVRKLDVWRDHLLDHIDSLAIGNLPDLPSMSGNADEVSYWLSSHDFFSFFNQTFCLRIYNNYQRIAFHGSWVDHPLAAGKMHGITGFLSNPQILISFVQTTECILVLQLLDRRLHGRGGPDGLPALPTQIDGDALQLHVLKISVEQSLLPTQFASINDLPFTGATQLLHVQHGTGSGSNSSTHGSGGGADARESGVAVPTQVVDPDSVQPSVVLRANFAGGNYVLIPTIGGPSREQFVLKVFTISSFYLKILR